MNAPVLGNRGFVCASQHGILLLLINFSFCCHASSEMFQTGLDMLNSNCRIEKITFD